MERNEIAGHEVEKTGERVNRFFWLALFSIAMGFMEGAIVIYLRKIYYPDGFVFPLTVIEPSVGLVEFLREAATVIMLVAIGLIAGRSWKERFLYFIYCFGIWDIIYYVVLKIFLDWPASILDWDILFLIPIPWVGPVLAPCIVSLTMIGIAFIFIDTKQELKRKDVVWMIAGCLVIIYSFCVDYIKLIFDGGNSCWKPGSSEGLFLEISNYVPVHYSWMLFVIGECMILFAGIRAFLRRNPVK